jgi:hypothetical protein
MGIYRCFEKRFTMVFQMLVWQVLRKRFWNTIVKLFFKHPALPVEVALNRNYPW